MRKPGHSWQDNELYDVFQPLIGPHGVSLYCNLSRRAYGEVLEYSLRELGDKTGMSRMTVARTMAVMEHLGMVRVRIGRGSAAGEFALVDLKDLAEALGARPIQNGKSHLLDAEALTRLRAECAAVRARLDGRGAERTLDGCVPQGDTKDCGKPSVCVPQRDTSAAVVCQNEGVCVPPEGHATFSVSRPKQKTNTPPLPLPPAGGGRGDSDARLDHEAGRVAQACGATARGVARAIRAQMAMRGGDPEELAVRMIAAWEEYSRIGDELLRFTWGARRFFGEGHWANAALWPIDKDRRELARGARVGFA